MRKKSFILVAFVLAASILAVSALAADASVSDVVAAPGETATVTISVNDIKSFQCFEGAITYGEGLRLKSIEAAGIINGAFDVTNVTQASEVDGKTALFAFNKDNGKFAFATESDVTAGSGEVFNLTFEILPALAEGGRAEVSLVSLTFFDAAAGVVKALPVETKTSGGITVRQVTALLLGDCDGNGEVDRADRAYLAMALIGRNRYAMPSVEVGDCDNDGTVTRSDRIYLARALAGWKDFALN